VCPSYPKVGTFRVHLLRKHHKTPVNFDNDALDNDENNIGNQEEDYPEMEVENDLHRSIKLPYSTKICVSTVVLINFITIISIKLMHFHGIIHQI
jgi:hypothetical protein